ncbi:MAG TPA: amidinotransferase, partial [Lysinibacillus sp.]|nr:amidinotransferase [Lysinibacillus sp.]
MHYCSSMYAPLKHVIVKHPKDAFRSQAHLSDEWKTFNYLSEPNY